MNKNFFFTCKIISTIICIFVLVKIPLIMNIELFSQPVYSENKLNSVVLKLQVDMHELSLIYNGKIIEKIRAVSGSPNTPTSIGTWSVRPNNISRSQIIFSTTWGLNKILPSDIQSKDDLSDNLDNTTNGDIWVSHQSFNMVRSFASRGAILIVQNDKPIFREISFGIKGYDVLVLQQCLAEKGYLAAQATGIYDNLTQSAVKLYQKDHALYQSGNVNINTYLSIIR